MRYNKLELFAIASQTSHNFDREGVLILKERQDGFFRRSEGCTVRWCRLRGNLLFYLKGPEPWCEPVGVILLGNFQVAVQPQDENGYWPFHLIWDNGLCYRLATFLETERTLWLKAINSAPYENLSRKMSELRDKLKTVVFLTREEYMIKNKLKWDINETPVCEVALNCDNLLCSESGRPPTTYIKLFIAFPDGTCVVFANTEIVEKCSNPCFSRTIMFHQGEMVPDDAMIRLCSFSIRELTSRTEVPVGSVTMRFGLLQEAQRLRLPLLSRYNKTVGFLTINAWSLEPIISGPGSVPANPNERFSIDVTPKVFCHRRSQSLPPRLGLKLKYPMHGPLLSYNFPVQHQMTYRFHSGLGGEIMVHEIMAEPRFGFSIAKDTLDIYLAHERDGLQTMMACSQICAETIPRHKDYVGVHHAVIQLFNSAKASLDALPGFFKPSSKKEEIALSYAPVNLHLQRMWVHNDTLNKSGFHDVITVGAFAAHARTDNFGGLLNLLKTFHSVSESSPETATTIHNITVEYNRVQSARLLRDSIFGHIKLMIGILRAGHFDKLKETQQVLIDAVVQFCMIFDAKAIEQALSRIGWHRAVHADLADHTTPKECLPPQTLHMDTNIDLSKVYVNIPNGATYKNEDSKAEATNVIKHEEDKKQELQDEALKEIKSGFTIIIRRTPIECVPIQPRHEDPNIGLKDVNANVSKGTTQDGSGTQTSGAFKNEEDKTLKHKNEATYEKVSDEVKLKQKAVASNEKLNENEVNLKPKTEAPNGKPSEDETNRTPNIEAFNEKQSENEFKKKLKASDDMIKQDLAAVSTTGAIPKIKDNKPAKKRKVAKTAAKKAAKAAAAAANSIYEFATDNNPAKTNTSFEDENLCYKSVALDLSIKSAKIADDLIKAEKSRCNESKLDEVQSVGANLLTGITTVGEVTSKAAKGAAKCDGTEATFDYNLNTSDWTPLIKPGLDEASTCPKATGCDKADAEIGTKLNEVLDKGNNLPTGNRTIGKVTGKAANVAVKHDGTEATFDYNLNATNLTPVLTKFGLDDAAIRDKATDAKIETKLTGVQNEGNNLPTGNTTVRKDAKKTDGKGVKKAKSAKASAKSAKAAAKAGKNKTALANLPLEDATINDGKPKANFPLETSLDIPAVNAEAKEKSNEKQDIRDDSMCVSNMANAAVKLNIIVSSAIYSVLQSGEDSHLAIEVRRQTGATSTSSEFTTLIKKTQDKADTASVNKEAGRPDISAAKQGVMETSFSTSAPTTDDLAAAEIAAKDTDQISDHDSESVTCTPVTESASLGTPSGGETETASIGEVTTPREAMVDGSETEGAWGYTAPGAVPTVPDRNPILAAALADYGPARTSTEHYTAKNYDRNERRHSTLTSRSKQKFKPKMELPSSTDRPTHLKRVEMKNIASCLEPPPYSHLSASRKCKAKSRGLYKTQQAVPPPASARDPFANMPEEVQSGNLEYFKHFAQIFNDLIFNLADCVETTERKRSCVQSDYIRTTRVLDELMKTIDECLFWMRMCHSALRILFETPEYARNNAALQCRRDTCFAQALTAVTVGLMSWLTTTPGEVVEAILRAKLTVLCGFEGLLTLFGIEFSMWGDMAVAIEDLHTVVFKICQMDNGKPTIPTVVGIRGALIVKMPVPDALFARLDDVQYQIFNITAVFFNIGINEKATLSQSATENKCQQSSNNDNLERLQRYYTQFTKVFPTDPMEQLRASSRSKPLEEVMENLRAAVQKRVEKNVEVLQLAAHATRLMHGVRFTSCKSAKDRTGMSVTLEQVSVLNSEYHLAENQRQKALHVMRSEGCRRANTSKNTGFDKYAFLKKQVQALPPDYRPPQGTYGSTHT